MSDDLAARRARKSPSPVGAFGVSGRRQAVIDRVMARVQAADVAAGRETPDPSRITCALNLRGMYGPGVDQACGVEEPTVDQWESGEVVPSHRQIQALAVLTGFLPEFFYGPPMPDIGSIFVCEVNQ